MTDKTIRLRWPHWDRGGLLIAAIYMLAGGLWIASSDNLAAILANGDQTYLTQISLYKGWAYVLVTGVLLYLLIHLNSRNLRRAHRNYLLLAENISDVVWVLDLQEGRFTYISPSIQQLRGLTPEEALRETPQQAMSPQSWEYISSVLPARIGEFQGGVEKVHIDHLSQPRKDGSNIWVEVSSRFVHNRENGHLEVYAVSRDVTERTQAREALERSEQKFSVLFEKAISAASLSSLADGTIVDVNEAFEKTFGYTRQEAVGHTTLELGINPNAEIREKLLAALQASQSARNVEMVLQTKSGEMRLFSVDVDVVQIGGERYILNTSHDITERTQAENALREAHALFQKTFNLSPIAAVLTNASEQWVVDVNAAAEAFFGYTRDEMVGQPAPAFANWVNPAEREQAFKRLFEDGRLVDFEYTFQDRTGQTGQAVIYAEIIEQHSERFVLSMYIDITERRQAEEKLRKSEERFRSAFDNMLEGCQIISSDWRYLYLNSAAERHNRRPNSELLGNRYMDMWPGIEATPVFSVIQHCMKTGESMHLENRFVYPDGRVGWFDLSIEAALEGVFILSVDVTERVLAQQHSQQMTRLYATLSQVNQTIVRSKKREQVFQSVCNLAVEYGGFAMAWVGLLEEDTGDVRPVAANGMELERWPFPIINMSTGPSQNGVIAAALRSSLVMAIEDVQVDERTRGLRPYIKGYNFHSLASVPFQLQGRTIGVLNLISNETGHFKDEEELSLLQEMGMDISFALDTMEKERIRQQWADAFEHCGHGIAIGLPTGKLLTCNPAFARQHHASVEDISSMPIMDMYLPQDRERIGQLIRQSDREGNVQFEAVKLCKDGSFFPAQVDLVSVRDVNGALLYRVATQQDITDRRQAEAQVRKSQQLAQDTIDALADSLCVLDENATIIAVNRAWREFADANPPAPENYCVGLNYLEVCDQAQGAAADEAAFFAVGLRALMRGEHDLFTFEYPCHVPQGERRWFVARALRFVVEGQMRMVITHENVTARKQMEEELRTSEERYRNLVENMNDLVMEVDAEGSYQYISPNYEAFSGYSVQEEVGRPALAHVHPEDLPMVLEKLHMAQQFEQQQDATYRVQNRHGEWRWLEVSGKPYRTVDGNLRLIVVARDITERRQAEADLRQSEENFSKAFMSSPSALMITRRADGTFVELNDALTHLFGYTREDLLGRQASQFNLYVDKGQRQELVSRLLADGSLHNYETTIRSKDGQHRSVLASLELINFDGEPSILSTLVDITERKEAEKKALENARQMQALVTSLDDIVFEIDQQGRYLNIWAADERLLLRPRAELLGKNIVEVLGEDLGRTFLAANARVLTGGVSEVIEYPLMFGEEQYWFAARINPILAQDVTSNSLSILVRDITERKQAEENIRRSEAQYRYLFENNPHPMWAYDLQTLHFLAVNESAVDKYGYSREEFLQMTIADIRPPEDVARLLADIQSERPALQHSGGWRHRLKDGKVIDVDISSHTLTLDGHNAALVVAQDVTERKQAERQIQRQLQRLSALTEIDRAINSSLDMRLSLDILLSEVLPQLEVHAAAILLLNTPMLTLECVAAKGFRSMSIRQARLRLGEGLAGLVGLERRMIHIPDLTIYKGYVKRADVFKGENFVEYFGVPLIAKGSLKGVLEIFHRTPLDSDQDWINYLETLSGQAAIAIDNAQLFEGMQQSNLELIIAYDATIAGWSHAMDLRDKETEGHTLRVTDLTVRLAEKMQLSQQDIIHLRRGALLHDIGKLGVPDHILLKPGPLTEEEWEIMRQHPAYAYNMLAPIIYLRPALDIPYCHHEKWDGSGYPRGLKGDQIPLTARLFSIVDVWDALRSDRPYRARWSVEKTRQYLIEQSGRHFDPKVVEAFLSVIENEV